jgi:hypothetical protein
MTINMQVKKMSKQFVANANVIRKINKLSYRGMARAIGVSDSTVRRMELARKTRFGRGEQGYIPTLTTVVKMADAVGCEPADLLIARL